jgi:hypothetical protein
MNASEPGGRVAILIGIPDFVVLNPGYYQTETQQKFG